MLSKKEMKYKRLEIIKDLRNKQIEYCSEELIKQIQKDGMTCDECKDNDSCEMAYDLYNTYGDCIMLK